LHGGQVDFGNQIFGISHGWLLNWRHQFLANNSNKSIFWGDFLTRHLLKNIYSQFLAKHLNKIYFFIWFSFYASDVVY
jgi:hypothetical protein